MIATIASLSARWCGRRRHKEWALNLGGSSLALPVKMDKHLRRNVKLEEMHLRAVAQTSDACCQCVASWALRVTMWRAGQKHRRLFTSDAASSNAQRQQIRKEDPAETKLHDTDLELEFCWTHKLDAFMERARQKFLRVRRLALCWQACCHRGLVWVRRTPDPMRTCTPRARFH